MHTVFRASSPAPRNLLAKQLPDSFHNTVLLGVVRVVLGRNLKQARESLVVRVDFGSYALSNLGDVLAKCIGTLLAVVAW
jgi:hypothetical protein